MYRSWIEGRRKTEKVEVLSFQRFAWLLPFTVRNSVDVDSSGSDVRADQMSHFLSLETKDKQGSEWLFL